ncbi:hypothetical protein [Erwinia sp. HR93]|uniref:hypothetical protein n=1 Tax=Erwinia sp. HR93 TaxID=3094840 RepID=UPI002ADEC806|nr:hypothetical protein [Erwinia sp. HR93]MEA1064386.1 hypothetical protein [Erwinia sp. HR93]
MNKYALLFSAFILTACANASAQYPKDVEEFIKQADDCQYLAGEWDSTLPAPRQKELEKTISEVCPKAKAQQEVLRGKYRDSKAVLDTINGYDF